MMNSNFLFMIENSSLTSDFLLNKRLRLLFNLEGRKRETRIVKIEITRYEK